MFCITTNDNCKRLEIVHLMFMGEPLVQLVGWIGARYFIKEMFLNVQWIIKYKTSLFWYKPSNSGS